MLHFLKLQPHPFLKIKDGTKTIEVRLYDEKRQLLNVGDEIEFTLMDDASQKLRVKVKDLIQMKTFEELFYAYPPELFRNEKKEDWVSIYKYYTKEQEAKYGVLGIKIVLID